MGALNGDDPIAIAESEYRNAMDSAWDALAHDPRLDWFSVQECRDIRDQGNANPHNFGMTDEEALAWRTAERALHGATVAACHSLRDFELGGLLS